MVRTNFSGNLKSFRPYLQKLVGKVDEKYAFFFFKFVQIFVLQKMSSVHIFFNDGPK